MPRYVALSIKRFTSDCACSLLRRPSEDDSASLLVATAIAYHRFAIPGGDGTHREVCLDHLYFNADGTIAPVKPTL